MNKKFARGLARRWLLLAGAAAVVVLVLVVAVTSSFADDKAKPDAPVPPAPATDADCTKCHTCAKPSAQSPCLRECTRHQEEVFTEARAHGLMPEGTILLDMLSDVKDETDHFGPVPFDHTGHADWAEIAGGCQVCHHHTPEGEAHPACRTCHEHSYRHEDLSKPGLKGAYHRQCMGCHREWTHETKCSTCHLPRIGDPEHPVSVGDPGLPPRDAFHKPIPEPELEKYPNAHPPEEGSVVLFYHKRHSTSYGFKCAECHRGDTCARCHEKGKQHVQVVGKQGSRHDACDTCHQIENACDHCHLKPGAPAPKPFEHAQTGWPLNKYHVKLKCRDCHKEMPFRKLERECTACHKWDSDSFDHAVTGQTLNEDHADVDCGDCHADNKYGQPPRCDECHDEEVTFPQQRPGPWKEMPSARAKPAP